MRLERTEEIERELPVYDVDHIVRWILISQRTFELDTLYQKPKYKGVMKSGIVSPSPLANVVIPTNVYLGLIGNPIQLDYSKDLGPEVSQPLSPENAFIKSHKLSLLERFPRPNLDDVTEQQYQALLSQLQHHSQLEQAKQAIYFYLDFRDEFFKRLVIYCETHGIIGLRQKTDCLGRKLKDPRPEITRQIFPNSQEYLESHLGIIDASETYARAIQSLTSDPKFKKAIEELTTTNRLLRKEARKDAKELYS